MMDTEELKKEELLCFTCGKTFANKAKLRRHSQNHFNVESSCTQCNAKYMNKLRLKKHVNLLHCSDNVFNCDQCDKQFSIRHNLNKHVKTSHGGETETVNCSFCQDSFHAPSIKVHEDRCREKYLRDIKKRYNPNEK